MEPRSLALQVDSLPAEPQEAQEYWSGWPIPSPADLPDPRIRLGAPALQADSLPTELLGKPNVLFSAQLNTFKDLPEVPRGPS